MPRNRPETSLEDDFHRQLRAHDRSIVRTMGVMLLVLGWSFVFFADRVAGTVREADSGGALLLTAFVVVAALSAIGAGCAIAIAAAESPTRYVFHSRPTLLIASILLFGGTVIVVTLVIRPPFDRLVAQGELTPSTVRDVGCILASIVSFVGGGVAALSTWDARRDERMWTRRQVT